MDNINTIPLNLLGAILLRKRKGRYYLDLQNLRCVCKRFENITNKKIIINFIQLCSGILQQEEINQIMNKYKRFNNVCQLQIFPKQITRLHLIDIYISLYNCSFPENIKELKIDRCVFTSVPS